MSSLRKRLEIANVSFDDRGRTCTHKRETNSAVIPDLVKAAIDARRQREQLFGADLFSDPAWDILLELFLAQVTQQRVATTDLGFAAGVPPTTALRWIDKLERAGWIARRKDPLDARRTFVQLSDSGCDRMQLFVGGEQWKSAGRCAA